MTSTARTFLATLGAACNKTGWPIHAFCFMGNHFHLHFQQRIALLAVRLRRETPMTRTWITQRLVMGSASYVSHLTKEKPPRDRPRTIVDC